MTLGELLSGLDGVLEADAGRAVAGLSADSRTVQPGFVFFAVPGARADGAAFVRQAVDNGAVAVVAEGEIETAPAALVRVTSVRVALARAAARFFPRQPGTVVAVTGTSGKTSVTAFLRQIWTALGHPAASLGTIGVVAPGGSDYGSLTTPDPIALHATLDRLAGEGVTHLALEASSHGLDQHRLDGLRLAAGGFTNLSHDHLDYHGSTEAYLAAKLRLFTDLVPPGGYAVIDADGEASDTVRAAAEAHGLAVTTTGAAGTGLRLLSAEPRGFATALRIEHAGAVADVELPLAGAFQVSNALLAAGLCIATGSEPGATIAALGSLEGAPGRLERVGARRGAPVFVDYAHKPDALDKVLATLRPYATGRLVVVLGCGGDRDAAKRPLMGAIAARGADLVIVTDDNPRSEDPAAIRAAILAAAPGGIEIADRGEAIRQGIGMLRAGDVLLIAGKGHETGQIVGDTNLPFSDHAVARAALDSGTAAEPRRETPPPLWTGFALVSPLNARVAGSIPPGVTGVSIDTRTLAPGELFVAIKGENGDGHDHVRAALDKGAAAALVDEAHAEALRGAGALFVVKDTLAALIDLGVAARARSAARIVAVTGSVGKTGTKEALRLVLGGAGETHASAASYNNHWGVPLTLARMPKAARFGVFEIGMNHAGEIEPLVGLVRPHVAIVTTVAPVHLEYFASVAEIADAKAEIFSGLEPGGTAIINRDIDTFFRLSRRAETSPAGRILTFGENPGADARLDALHMDAEGSTIEATVLGQPVSFRLGAPGRHQAMNALAVLLAAEACGVAPFFAGLSLAGLAPGAGRGERTALQAEGGAFTLIDESYNANPASMRAALALLGGTSPGPGGRRIAVIGEMRELGPEAARLHEGLAPDVADAQVDSLFAAGALAKPLFDAMPAARQGLWAPQAAALEAALAETIRAGDVVMVKGSNGSRMGPIVAALKRRFGPEPAGRRG